MGDPGLGEENKGLNDDPHAPYIRKRHSVLLPLHDILRRIVSSRDNRFGRDSVPDCKCQNISGLFLL